jgi:hypothetical protein
MSLKILYFAVIAVGMCSCIKYQYLSVNSNLSHEEGKGFVLNADSVQISYQFSGTNGPVQIEVLNKTSHPLYLDWSKSAIIVNGEVHSYWKNESAISAVADGKIDVSDKQTTYSSHSISGKLTGPSSTDFIPPNATLKRSPVALAPDFFNHTTSSENKRTEGKGAFIVVINEYDSANSPMQFRSYLSISNALDFTTVSTFDHSFWISHVYRAEHSLKKRFTKDNNTFQVIKSNTTASDDTRVRGRF